MLVTSLSPFVDDVAFIVVVVVVAVVVVVVDILFLYILVGASYKSIPGECWVPRTSKLLDWALSGRGIHKRSSSLSRGGGRFFHWSNPPHPHTLVCFFYLLCFFNVLGKKTLLCVSSLMSWV